MTDWQSIVVALDERITARFGGDAATAECDLHCQGG